MLCRPRCSAGYPPRGRSGLRQFAARLRRFAHGRGNRWSYEYSYEFAPILVFVDLAAYGFAELGGDSRGHRARARDRAVVDRVHRADLGRGAAHEHLLRDVEVATGQVVDAHLETVVA